MIRLSAHPPAEGGWVILASYLGAFLLMAYPLPPGLALLRPEFVCLAMIYWTTALPRRGSIAAAFGLGLLLDAVERAPLGQHALALSVVAYLCLKLYHRMRLFSLWQQSALICALLGIHQLACAWLQGFAGIDARGAAFLAPVPASALAWPAVAVLLRYLQVRYRVG